MARIKQCGLRKDSPGSGLKRKVSEPFYARIVLMRAPQDSHPADFPKYPELEWQIGRRRGSHRGIP
jgi:hypothetical protein